MAKMCASHLRSCRTGYSALPAHLEHPGLAVIDAAEEGGAVIIIVGKDIERGEYDGVGLVAIAYITYILVLLVYPTHSSLQIYMEMNHHITAIDAALQALRADTCRSLHCVHAMTGCDATSAMFGVGKTKAFKVSSHRKNFRRGRLCLVI